MAKFHRVKPNTNSKLKVDPKKNEGIWPYQSKKCKKGLATLQHSPQKHH